MNTAEKDWSKFTKKGILSVLNKERDLVSKFWIVRSSPNINKKIFRVLKKKYNLFLTLSECTKVLTAYITYGGDAINKCFCEACGKRKVAYVTRFCSKKCAANSKKTTEARIKTVRKKYGVDNISQSNQNKEKIKEVWKTRGKEIAAKMRERGYVYALEREEIRNKAKATCKKKYGFECPWKNKKVREKIAKTMQERYGADNWFKLKEERKKRNLELFGVEYYSSTEKARKTQRETWAAKSPEEKADIVKRRESTNLGRYGVHCTLLAPTVKEKIRKKLLERYGVDNPLKSKKIWLQSRKTCIEEGKKIHGPGTSVDETCLYYCLVNMFPEVIRQYRSEEYPYSCDFYIPEIDTYIEYQGSHFHGPEPYDRDNKEHRRQVRLIKKKIKNRPKPNQYAAMLRTWTKRDPDKRKTAKKNGLNFIEFFTLTDFFEWRKHILIERERSQYIKVVNRVKKFVDKIGYVGSIKVLNPIIHAAPKYDSGCVYIFQEEWENNSTRLIWKSMLKSRAGLNKVIYARKCVLGIVSKTLCSEFLSENHIQGDCRSARRYGLYYGNELVMVLTIGKPRFNKTDNSVELIRLCAKRGLNIVGGASRLLKAVTSEFDTIISYSNRRFSEGNVYKMLGFEKVAISKPNYWYFTPNEKVMRNRLAFQRHKLDGLLPVLKESWSESEAMLRNGYKKRKDVGNLTFVYKL